MSERDDYADNDIPESRGILFVFSYAVIFVYLMTIPMIFIVLLILG
jgi:hypothetical protein